MLSASCWKRSVFALLSVAVCLFGVALAFECTDGCVIADSYLNDDSCDCIDCGDETEFTCDSCPGCPQLCGQNTTCVVPTATGFKCTDGCHIADSKVDDGNCDCVDCADENAFSCDSCLNGCPDSCGASSVCALLLSTTTPKPIEKVAKSGNYQCVNASDLVPWFWIAVVTLWQYAKIMWNIYTCFKEPKAWRNRTKQTLVQTEAIAFMTMFVLDILRFNRKRIALNGWQQYTCFAEIWMFSSNMPRIYSIVSMFLPFGIPPMFTEYRYFCFDPRITAFQTLFLSSAVLLHIPIYLTHVLPMFFMYCWFIVPLFFALLLFTVAVWYFGGFPDIYQCCYVRKGGVREMADFKAKLLTIATLFCTVLLGSGLIMFSVALGANYYHTGRYMHSLKVVLYGRNTQDFFSSMSFGRFLKFIIWVL